VPPPPFISYQSKRFADLNCRKVATHRARAPCQQSIPLQDPVILHSDDHLMQHIVIIGRFAEATLTLDDLAKPLDINA
jgi:hypothetical protein